MPLTVSSARIDITPADGYSYMAGYATPGGGFRVATGSHSDLSARCVVLHDGVRPRGIVSVDVVGFDRVWHQALRPRLLALASWTSPDVVLLATHTHNGPMPAMPDPMITYGLADPPATEAYWDWLADRIVELVNAALNGPQTGVTLDYRVTSQNWSMNRAGLAYVESVVPVLVARRVSDGQPAVVLFQFGTHPVTAGTQTRWDGDYPAAACAVIEAAIPGSFALSIPGAAGDQDPGGTRGWALRDRLGAQLGAAVVSAASGPGRSVGAPISTASTEVIAPLDVVTTPAGFAALRAGYAVRAASGQQPAWNRRHAEAMIEQLDAGTQRTTMELPITVWKLAGSPTLRLAFCAGELCSGYAVYFRSLYGGANGLMIGGYANEVCCYVCGDEFFPPHTQGGSYEGGWETDLTTLAGGAMIFYGGLGHFRHHTTGSVESVMVSALSGLLAG